MRQKSGFLRLPQTKKPVSSYYHHNFTSSFSMQNYYENSWSQAAQERFVVSGKANAFLRQVYITMALGLAITGVTSWFFGQELIKALDGLYTPFLFLWTGPMRWITMLSPLAVVLVMNFAINRMSFSTASILFGVYALLMGVSLSSIFAIFSAASIFKTFFVASAAFGAMAAIGLFTKRDLSKFGSILMMGVIGLIVAGLVNMFLKSPVMDYIVSGFGVLIFCGLTAYDTQKLMEMGAGADMENESIRKASVIGALNLYLDFVNLFLYLLRFFGSSRD